MTQTLSARAAALSVAENASITPIGILAPTDLQDTPDNLVIQIVGLPTNGSVSEAGGYAVQVGDALTVAQLTDLAFTPAPGTFDVASQFLYSVADSYGATANGAATLSIGPAIGDPVAASMTAFVPVGSFQAALDIPVPTDPNFTSSQLTVTIDGSPTSGLLSLTGGDGLAVTTCAGSDLPQLVFTPSPAVANQTAEFSYTVTDPANNSSTGTVTIEIGGTEAPPPVSATPPSDSSNTGADSMPAPAGNVSSIADPTGPQSTPITGTQPSPGTDPAAGSAGATATVSSGSPVGAGPSIAGSPTVKVDENSQAVPIGLAAPTDAQYDGAQLTITAGDLPTNGTLLYGLGGAVVASGDTMSIAQLTALQFVPTPGMFGKSSAFTYVVTDPAQASGSGTVTLEIGPALGNPAVSSPTLSVSAGASATPIGIVTPTDPNYTPNQLAITATGLPSNGSVTLASGTAVKVGDPLSVADLTGLQFTPSTNTYQQSSTFTYSVVDPAGHRLVGSAELDSGKSLDVDPETGKQLPILRDGHDGDFSVTNVGQSRAGVADGAAYTGPVGYLQKQLIWDGSQPIAAKASVPSVFLKGGSAGDALQVTGGSNVLDGGGGSNFLVGGTGSDGGSDVFFVDARGTAVTWSTIINFHAGDQFTLWGFKTDVSTTDWQSWDGASGYEGVSLHSSTAGEGTGVNASVTFAGITKSIADAAFALGTGDIDGTPYLHIAYNGA